MGWWSRLDRETAAGQPACTAAPTARATASPARSRRDGRLSSPPGAATAMLAVDVAVGRLTDGADHRACRRSPRTIAACRRSRMSTSTCAGRDPRAARRERRRQIDADQDHGRRGRADGGTMLYRRQRGAPTPRRIEALDAGIAMVFQETSLVPSMTVAQNLYLGDEKFLNRLRGIYIAAQQFLQSLNFPVDPTATVATPRRRQAADGRDRPRRAPQRRGHHLRRADGDADAGGEAAFLRADAPAEGARRVDRLHLPCAGGGADACRPHHHPARRRAGR